MYICVYVCLFDQECLYKSVTFETLGHWFTTRFVIEITVIQQQTLQTKK